MRGSRKSIYQPAYEHALALLREARQQAGLSQQQLAARLGRPQNYVSKIERGERRVDILELLEFLSACEASAVRFLEEMRTVLPHLKL